MSKLIVTGCERMDQLSREETVDRRQVFHSHMQTTEIQVIHHFNKIDEPGIEKPSAPVFLTLHMPAGNRFILPEKLERQYLSRQQPTSIYVASSSTGENLTPSDHIYIISREIQPDPKKKISGNHIAACIKNNHKAGCLFLKFTATNRLPAKLPWVPAH